MIDPLSKRVQHAVCPLCLPAAGPADFRQRALAGDANPLDGLLEQRKKVLKELIASQQRRTAFQDKALVMIDTYKE
jgi:hypothetical protein